MTRTWKFPKIFFGWWTVIGLGLISFIGMGVVYQSFSVFFKPLAAELGLSRAVTSVAASVQSGMGAVTAPVGGWASDKYGPRRLILIGVIILAAGCILMFFINSFWSFILVFAVIGIGGSLGLTILTDKAIVNWFIKKAGIAINVKFAIMALSGLLLLPVVAWLVEMHGWRTTYVIGGVVIAITCIPIVWFLVKPHRPEHYGLQPDGTAQTAEVKKESRSTINIVENEAEFTFGKAVRTSSFWLLVLIGYVSGIINPMMGAHSVPFLTDRGIDPVEAATMMGLMSTVSVPARLLTGFMVDRLKTNHLRFLMAGGTLLQAVGVALFLITSSTAMIYVWFIIHGIGGGINQSVNIPLMARYFGRKAFGAITGVFQPLALPIGLAGPILIGHIYDTTGSYMSIIYIMPLVLLAAAAISCFILPPAVRKSLPERATAKN